jgi:hypothetical protein
MNRHAFATMLLVGILSAFGKAQVTTETRPVAELERPVDERQVLEIYDVRDLINTHANSRADELKLLAALIEEELPQPLKNGFELLDPSGAMVLRALPSQHQWLDRFLQAQRARPELVLIQTNTFEVAADSLESLGMDPANRPVIMTPEEGKALLEILSDSSAVSILAAPSLAVLPRQSGEVRVMNRVAYVKDWKVEVVQPGNVTIADPVIDRVEEGFEVKLRAYPTGAEGYRVSLEYQQSHLQRPMVSMEVGLDGLPEQKVKITVPVVVTTSLKTELRLNAGAMALFTAPAGEQGKVIGVMFSLVSTDLRPEDVREQDAEKAPAKKKRDGKNPRDS